MSTLSLLLLFGWMFGGAGAGPVPSSQGPGPDALTELDLALKENVRLQKELVRLDAQHVACRMELAPVVKAKNDAAVAKAEAALKARIEAAHPCCQYNVDTGRLEVRPPVAPERKP